MTVRVRTGSCCTSEETAALCCAPRPLGAAPSWMACAAENSRRQQKVSIALSGCVGSDEKRSSGFAKVHQTLNQARESAVCMNGTLSPVLERDARGNLNNLPAVVLYLGRTLDPSRAAARGRRLALSQLFV